MSLPVAELFAKLGIDVDESGVGRAIAAIEGLKTGLIAVGAVAAGLGVALAGMVKATVDYGSKVNDLAARAGVSTEQLQKLGHVASLSGISMEEMAQAMNFAVRKNGVKDLAKEFSNASDKIKELTTQGKGAEAAKLAMDRFGRRGAALVPFLREGSKRIAELAQEFDDLGLVIDEKTVKAADELGDRIDVANASFKGLAYTIAGPLLKPLTEVVNVFIEWMKVHRKLIAARVHAGLKLIARAFKVLQQLAQPVVDLFKFLADHTWLLKAALVVLAVALTAQLGLAIQSAVLGFGALLVRMAAVATVGAATGLAIAALAAIVALVGEDIYQFLTGGESLTERWGKKWVEFIDELTQPLPDDPDWLVWLKVALRVMGDLQSSWQFLKGEMTGDKFFGEVLGLDKGRTSAHASPLVGADAHGGWVGALMEGLGAKPGGLGGGAASPDASVQRAVNSVSGRTAAPNVNQTLNVTQPPGSDSAEFAKMFADHATKNLEKIFSEAAAGVL